MINRQHIHALISIAWLATSLFMLWLIPMSEFGYSVLMCLNFIWVLYVIWKAEKLSCNMEGRKVVAVLPIHGYIYLPIYRWTILGRAGYA